MRFLCSLLLLISSVSLASSRYVVQVESDFNLANFKKQNQQINVIDYFQNLDMMLIEMSDSAIVPRSILARSIEEDKTFYMTEMQQPAPWGLDRIDQRQGLNNIYFYHETGESVHAYVVDSGIRSTHLDFGGRIGKSYSAIGGGIEDCNGHGTHVSGTIGGNYSGVAKKVMLHSVRVFGCSGGTSMSTIVNGLDWILGNVERPAVVNMSLGGGNSSLLNSAIKRLFENDIVVVVAAGNENSNACYSSPANSPYALTVGATTDRDARASFSNWGECVDIFAPGEKIRSAWYTSDKSGATISGTSMASPHVAGAVALYFEKFPDAKAEDVFNAVIEQSTKDVLAGVAGSPNLLLFK